MSQVDDWSDGYTSDYLRDLNTYGPASANVPRPSSVVSRRVQYQPPVAQTEAKTNDTPLYSGGREDLWNIRSGQDSGWQGRAGQGSDWGSSGRSSSSRSRSQSGESGTGRSSGRSSGRGTSGSMGRSSGRSTNSRVGRSASSGTGSRSTISGADVTADVMKALKADGNTSFADWRSSLKRQGFANADSIKYDPTTGKFIDTTGGSMPSAPTGTYKDASDPLSQRILANGSPEPKPPVESVVSRAQDITNQSDMYRAIAGLSSPPSANDSQSEVRASVPETNFNRGLMGGVGRQVESMRAPDSEQAAPEPFSAEGQFKNMPWYEDAKAHHEAVKKNMDDYGSALGMLKSTWDDIPWWAKLLMLPPVFKAGSPAAGASTTGNVWAEGSRAAAGDATAGARTFEESLSRMNGGAVRGAPVEGTARRSFSSAGTATGAEAAGTAGREAAAAGDAAAGAGGRSFGFDLSAEDVAAANAANAAARQQAVNLSEMRSTLMRAGMPDREIEAYMRGAGFYNDPEALRQAIDVVRKYGMAGLFEHSAARAGSAAGTGAGSAAGTGAGSAAGTGSRGSFRFDLSPEEIASAKASHDAYVRGTAGAADGGVSELANAGNVGRETAAGGAAARQGAGEAAGALAPQLQKDLSAVRQKVSSEGDSFERIRDVLRTSGGRQELLPANIREACEPLRRIMEQGGGAALTPAEREAVQLYMNRPVASGAAGAAGAARGAPQDSVAEIANADKVGSTATRTGGSTNTAGWQMTAAEIRNEKAALSSFRTIPAGLSPLKLVAEIRSVWAKGVKSGFEDPARMATAVHEVYGLSPDEATRLVLLIKDGEAGRGALAPLFRSSDAYGATLPK